MEIFLLASVLELNPLDHVQLRGSRLCTATEGRSHMLKSYGRVQSLRTETRPEDEARTLSGAHVCLQESRDASASLVLSPFHPLCPLVDVPVPKGFCDLSTILSSTFYFLMPCGRPCPFRECCGGAGEVGVVVPSAHLQSHTSITDRTSLSLGIRILRIPGHCSDSCFHHPITQADILLRVLRTGRLSLLEPKAAAADRHCSQSLPGTETSRMGDWPCLKE